MLSQKDQTKEENRSLVDYFYAGDVPRASATLVGEEQENSLGGDEDIYAQYHKQKPTKRSWSWMWSSEWWPAWWGLITFVILVGTAYAGFDGHLVMQEWDKVPADAFDTRGSMQLGTIAGLLAMAIFTWLLIIPGFADIVIEKGESWSSKRGRSLTIQLLMTFGLLSLIAFVAFFVGTEKSLVSQGFGNELWAIVIGMALCNGLSVFGIPLPETLTIAAKSGETFVKTGLILLGIDLQTLGGISYKGIVVAIPVTAICVTFGYYWARKLVNIQQRKMAMCLVGGTSVCGNSAATAVQTTIGAGPEDLTVAISILSMFTIVQMLVVPPIAVALLGKGNFDNIAAAIGGSINSTGPVVAAASYLKSKGAVNAVTIASIIKVIQNSMIGFVAVGIAVYWATYEEAGGFEEYKPLPSHGDKVHGTHGNGTSNIDAAKDDDAHSVAISHSTYNSQGFLRAGVMHKPNNNLRVSFSQMSRMTTTTASAFLAGDDPARPKWWELLWIKFPKFVLMFLFLSVVLTVIKAIDGQPSGEEGKLSRFDALESLMKEASAWWFTLGFAGIGLKAQFSALYKALLRGSPVSIEKASTMEKLKFAIRPVAVYWITQTFNIVLTYSVAFALDFNGIDVG